MGAGDGTHPMMTGVPEQPNPERQPLLGRHPPLPQPPSARLRHRCSSSSGSSSRFIPIRSIQRGTSHHPYSSAPSLRTLWWTRCLLPTGER